MIFDIQIEYKYFMYLYCDSSKVRCDLSAWLPCKASTTTESSVLD